MYSNQMTEEIPHGTDDSSIKNMNDVCKQLHSFIPDLGHDVRLSGELLTGKAKDEHVISRSLDDIQTPPPNYANFC